MLTGGDWRQSLRPPLHANRPRPIFFTLERHLYVKFIEGAPTPRGSVKKRHCSLTLTRNYWFSFISILTTPNEFQIN